MFVSGQRGKYGVAILSRFPITEGQTQALPTQKAPAESTGRWPRSKYNFLPVTPCGIDFIAFRPEARFEIQSHTVIQETYASDHLPVLAVLRFKGSQ